MNSVSPAGLSSFLPQQAAAMKDSHIQMQVQVAVLKQTMDQGKAAGEALVRMIQGAPAGRIDIRV